MLAILIGLISVFFVKVVELAFNGFLHLEAILGWWLIAYVPLMMIFVKKIFSRSRG
jgi:hypothetical protein